MARRTPFKKALAAALGAGPCDAPILVERMYAAGWRPKRRPEDSVHGLQNSMLHRMDWRCRRGMAASVTLIMPVLYSPLITSTASVATVAWPSMIPVRLTLVVSAVHEPGHFTIAAAREATETLCMAK